MGTVENGKSPSQGNRRDQGVFTYTNVRNINVRVVVSVDSAAGRTVLVTVDVDRKLATRVVGTAHLEVVVHSLDLERRTRSVLRDIGALQ